MTPSFDMVKAHIREGFTYQNFFQNLDKVRRYARDAIYGYPSVLGTTLFSPITVSIELIDARRMKDKRLSFVDRSNWSAYCRFTYGVNPHKTYDEFIGQYDGSVKLTDFLERKLKNEKTPREYPFYDPNSSIFK